MKSKRSLYVLLPAVALIWGLIAQRIWSAAHHDAQPNGHSAESAKASLPNPESRPPALLLSYRDPFKGQLAALEHSQSRPFPTQASVARTASHAALNLPPPPPAPAAVTWPQVNYLGTITNRQAGTKVVLLSVDNAEVMLRTGDSEKGLKIIKAFSDSVRLMFQGQKKTFSRALAPVR